MSNGDREATMQGYDHRAEWNQGFDDATAGRPRRLAQTAEYRKGYDRGISIPLHKALGRGPLVRKA